MKNTIIKDSFNHKLALLLMQKQFSRAGLASRLNTTPDRVSNAMAHLRRCGAAIGKRDNVYFMREETMPGLKLLKWQYILEQLQANPGKWFSGNDICDWIGYDSAWVYMNRVMEADPKVKKRVEGLGVNRTSYFMYEV